MVVALGVSAGFVTVAPTADPTGTNNSFDANRQAFRHTSPVGNWAVVEMGWYCDNATQAANYQIGIYANGADIPDALIDFAEAAKGTSSGWKVVTGLNIPLTSNTVYWLAHQLDDTATATNANYTSIVSSKRSHVSAGQTALPDPWGAEDGNDTNINAIYARIESTGGTHGRIIGSYVY